MAASILPLACKDKTKLAAAGNDPGTFTQKVESARQSLAAAARRMGAPHWCSQLHLAAANSVSGGGGGGGNGTCGHRGFLFELFEIRPAHLHETAPIAAHSRSRALASLLGKK